MNYLVSIPGKRWVCDTDLEEFLHNLKLMRYPLHEVEIFLCVPIKTELKEELQEKIKRWL